MNVTVAVVGIGRVVWYKVGSALSVVEQAFYLASVPILQGEQARHRLGALCDDGAMQW